MSKMVWKHSPKDGLQIAPVIRSSIPVGFFDGAAQMGLCGAGCYIKLDTEQ